MAKQSQVNLKRRVSRLSRRVNGTERALRAMAGEVGQAISAQARDVQVSIGLTSTLIDVLEKSNPGLSQAIKDLAKERSEAAKKPAEPAKADAVP